MTKADRLNMLRERARALGVRRFVGRVCMAVPRREIKRRYFRHVLQDCADPRAHETLKRWVKVPDAAPDHAALKPHRIGRKTALTRIAERWDERRLDPSFGRRNGGRSSFSSV